MTGVMELQNRARGSRPQRGRGGRRLLLAALLPLVGKAGECSGAETKEPTMQLSVTVDFPSDITKEAPIRDRLVLSCQRMPWAYSRPSLHFRP